MGRALTENCHIFHSSGVFIMRVAHMESLDWSSTGKVVTVTIDSVNQRSGHSYQQPGLENTQPEEYFDSLFQAYWSKVRTLLASLVGDQDEAEDLALEVFWRLYTRPLADNKTQNLAGWIYRVATNLGYNALRSRKRRRHYEDSAGLENLETASALDPVKELEKAEQCQQIRQALSQLKPQSAQILVLRYTGLSYTEIATTLSLSPASVGTLLARAEREFEKRYRNIERGRT
jgi:RNA polymerase sigma-70 factor (ECF subfamily)